jgi:hypothetical protein
MSLKENVNLVVKLISENDGDISEDDLLHMIRSSASDKSIASELLTFIPIIMCRIILPNFHFPKSYIEWNRKCNIRKEIRFREHPLYLDIERQLEIILSNGFSQEDILKIAGRSPEFKIINDYLLKGIVMDNIGLGMIHINKEDFSDYS